MKTIIFDFDGTLADSLHLTTSIYRDLTGDRREMTEDEIEHLRKLPLHKVASEIGVPFWKIPFLLRKGRKVMKSRMSEIKPFDDLPEVCERLHKEGYKLKVLTSNSKENVESFLKRYEMETYFTEIHGSIGLFSKARKLKKVMKKDKLHPYCVWYVGDEARDVVASKKAGVQIVSVAWGYNHESLLRDLQPYAIVRTPHELYDVLSV